MPSYTPVLNILRPVRSLFVRGRILDDALLTLEEAIANAGVSQEQVDAAVAAVVAGAPGALNTLDELAAALGDDANYAATVTTLLAAKAAKAANLSDLTNAGTARTNLGLGTAATKDSAAANGVASLGSDTRLPLAQAPSSPFPPTSFDAALLGANSAALDGANKARYFRVRGSGTITKIGLRVGSSSGNISVAVLTGPAGASAPTTRVATSGAVACPANGYAEVPLGGSVAVNEGDWFAISADNTSATFGIFGSYVGASAYGAGRAYEGAAQHPIPSAPSGLAAMWGGAIFLIGVA